MRTFNYGKGNIFYLFVQVDRTTGQPFGGIDIDAVKVSVGNGTLNFQCKNKKSG